MDQSRTGGVAKQRFVFAAMVAFEYEAFGGIVFGQATRKRLAIGTDDGDGITALEIAFNGGDSGGKQARSLGQRLCRAGIDHQRALEPQPSPQPRLARAG